MGAKEEGSKEYYIPVGRIDSITQIHKKKKERKEKMINEK